jgi:hypothetical protein
VVREALWSAVPRHRFEAGQSGVSNGHMMEFFIENLIMHPERLMAPEAKSAK